MVQVKGTVQDEKGGIVSGALIAVEKGTSPSPDMALYTDADGHFTIELPVELFLLAAYSQDGKHGTAEYDSNTDQPLIIRISFSQ